MINDFLPAWSNSVAKVEITKNKTLLPSPLSESTHTHGSPKIQLLLFPNAVETFSENKLSLYFYILVESGGKLSLAFLSMKNIQLIQSVNQEV